MMEQPKKRGFACLNEEERKAMAKLGGSRVKPENRAFSKNRALASEAGKKGGSAVPPKKRAFFTDRAAAANAGRKGGLKSQS